MISWEILKEDGDTIIPTNAFALLTGRFPNQPVIQCAVFKGKTRAYFIDRREFEGSIQDQVNQAYQYVLMKINMGMRLNGIYRQDVFELPSRSIRELIANAVVHRSYNDPGKIQIALFDDRLEITSPGMLMNNVSIRKMKEGYSKLRNPAIAEAFSYMKIIENWGSGIPRLFQECEEYKLPQPELIDFDGDFRVNVYRNNPTQTLEKTTQDGENPTQALEKTTQDIENFLTKSQLDVLKIIQENPTSSQSMIAEKLNWKVDRVKYHLRVLKQKKVIEHIGSNQKGYWKIISQEKN